MNKSLSILACVSLLFFFSCSSDDKKIEEIEDQEILQEIETEYESSGAQKMFYALPSPFEISSLLKASGVQYNQNILNKADNLPNYSTTTKKALNLGVYGADVSITSIYDQTQQTMLYLSCVKSLADDLGITSAFDSGTMGRLDKGKESQDSLQHIIAEAYALANGYLKENSRSSSSSLILAGGWIEGVHIATSMVDPEKPNNDLIELIADQRFSIENLIALLELNNSEKDVADILISLKELNGLFQEIEETGGEGISSTKENGKMVIGGGSQVNVSPELLEKITKKVNSIRTGFIS